MRVLTQSIGHGAEQGSGQLELHENYDVTTGPLPPTDLCPHASFKPGERGTITLPKALVVDDYESETYCLDCVLAALKEA